MGKRLSSRSCWFKLLVVVGILLTTCGSLLIAYWRKLFESYMNKEIQIEPSSTSYPIWKDVDLPLYMEFYLFNWENPLEIFNHSIKPRFTEHGPYVFSEKRKKIIQRWCPENSTVTFRQNRTWYFEPNLSNGSLDDPITMLDSVAIAAPYVLRYSKEWLKLTVEHAMRFLDTKHYVTKTVREFIFEGYRDPLLDLANLLPSELIPLEIPFKKFAWMSERNGSANYDGIFNMYTGVDDITKLGSIGKWNYANTTGHYESYCSMTKGTAGEIFPPKPRKSSISLFASDFCRSLNLAYKEDVEVDGIEGFRFSADRKLFGSPKTEPNNDCFCSEKNGECFPDGVLNITSCKWGAPAFISLPHFFHGHQSYRDKIDGMTPNPEHHQLFIDLEKISGFPLQVNVSFQINMLLQPIEEYTLLKHMPQIMFPMLWFKQSLHLDKELGAQLKLFVFFSEAGTISAFALTNIGIMLLLLSVLLYTLYRRIHTNIRNF